MGTRFWHRSIWVIAIALTILVSSLLITSNGLHAAQAAPSGAGGIFTVNSNADSNSKDSVLTLREAMLIANGSLVGDFSDGEKAQIGGTCTWSGSSGSWTLTGGCGAGLNDEIYFANNYTITLGSILPELIDTGTLITAFPTQTVEIDGNDQGQIFQISGSYMKLNGLRIFNSITGTSNIWIKGAADHIELSNNVIGAVLGGFADTCTHSPHSYSGVYINSSSSVTVAWLYGNWIDCNRGTPGDGIDIVGSDHVVIGTDPSGYRGYTTTNSTYLNRDVGINLIAGADNNILVDTYSGYNSGDGLYINNSQNNSVYGSTLQGNSGSGIELRNGAANNVIGCQLGGPHDATRQNVIRDNFKHGIYIADASTHDNAIGCNWIGYDDYGFAAEGNSLDGILIDLEAHDNTIGNTTDERNAIGGNLRNGIEISGTAHDNVIAGNYIGTNVSGTASISNHIAGVSLVGGAYNNHIGGSAILTESNVIGGNGQYGVYIAGSSTTTNTLQSNDIGLNSSLFFIPIPNLIAGIILEDGTHANAIDAGNYIANNGLAGIEAVSGTYKNIVYNSSIFSNNGPGILLDDSTSNFIYAATIRNNTGDGIMETSGTSFNVWSHLNVYDNGGLGIDKFADSLSTDNVDPPSSTITSVVRGGGVITVSGTAPASMLLELYSVAPDPSGFGEGKIFVGDTSASAGGIWSIVDPSPSGGCYTLVEFPYYMWGSEFSANSCRTFLPLILKNH